ncbi:hypothetical protein PsYK624_049140 [Phanerochaete sordida]|uniref:Small secreted protein n=1 Tax=Phanerochaete sordida TaxID=48140 RepID=A0A9P3LCF4_9APHY|nr:hypothetical protein PsYK624_049140 [Phanerochaete sordida]
MWFARLAACLFAAASSAHALSPVLPASNGTFLELSAIVTKNNNSALECWRLTDPFATSVGAGTAGASSMDINNLANATYTVLPPRFEGGVHNAPHPQLVVFLSGVAHVTLPHGTDDAFVLGGDNGIIIAVDTTGTGHNTSYPSNQQTRALQIPFTGGIIPPHVVVGEGACTSDQIVTTPASG